MAMKNDSTGNSPRQIFASDGAPPSRMVSLLRSGELWTDRVRTSCILRQVSRERIRVQTGLVLRAGEQVTVTVRDEEMLEGRVEQFDKGQALIAIDDPPEWLLSLCENGG